MKPVLFAVALALAAPSPLPALASALAHSGVAARDTGSSSRLVPISKGLRDDSVVGREAAGLATRIPAPDGRCLFLSGLAAALVLGRRRHRHEAPARTIYG